MKVPQVNPLIYLIQPPFVQLNSPYPSIYYLRSFLEKRGFAVQVRDHSIALFEKIFCKKGLQQIFTDTRAAVSEVPDQSPEVQQIIARFFSEESRWISSIDRITGLLSGGEKEWGHLLCRTNGVLPGGPRFDACLEELCETKGDATPEDAPLLASKLLADIADFITAALDPGFSLIRYVPCPASGLSAGFRDFALVRKNLDGYVMRHFYRPFLESEWNNLQVDEKLFIGLSIPFPGCLPGALVCAESAKAHFGENVRTIAGGAYVNTELRSITDESLFDYFDYLSFDRGYASLDAILKNDAESPKVPLYKTIFVQDQKMIRHESIANDCGSTYREEKQLDDQAAVTTFPDYSGVNFSRYICPVDDTNPMHRLWSDGRWLKAYAAHGCYWQRCMFCDTSLDYIRSYKPVDVDSLFSHLLAQAEVTGIRGVHLVDEACPPAALIRLTQLNREAGLPLVFWGNIRFEKTFTCDTAALLAAGGLIGVSAGIEVACEKDFSRMDKGIDLATVTNVCAAFKESGILVHAYLIYGYWDETETEIINSAEILRQLFAAELLDSAFWHQFVLTVHSRLYAEKLQGLHPKLQPSEPQPSEPAPGGEKVFAVNDRCFEGESRFNKYAAPLENLLAQWMQGDTSTLVPKAFPFKVAPPTVPPDLIPHLIDTYARTRDKERSTLPQQESARVLFLGSTPHLHREAKVTQLNWRYKLGDCSLHLTAPQVEQTVTLLKEAVHGISAAQFFSVLESIFASEARNVWEKLRHTGLVVENL